MKLQYTEYYMSVNEIIKYYMVELFRILQDKLIQLEYNLIEIENGVGSELKYLKLLRQKTLTTQIS